MSEMLFNIFTFHSQFYTSITFSFYLSTYIFDVISMLMMFMMVVFHSESSDIGRISTERVSFVVGQNKIKSFRNLKSKIT